MTVKNLARRLYAPEYLIKPRYWIGEKPPAKAVYGELTHVAWPSITEAVLISLLTFVDTAMVATVGPQAVAAVGITNQPRFIFYALFFALNVGTTVIVSRRFGQQDRPGANKCLEQSLLLSVAASAILVTLSFFVTRTAQAATLTSRLFSRHLLPPGRPCWAKRRLTQAVLPTFSAKKSA